MNIRVSNKVSRGFTLIELLVVISVVSILVSVVLASMRTSRAKGADAAIKSQLAELHVQSSLHYDTYGHYGILAISDCPSVSNTNPASWAVFYNPEVKKIIERAGLVSGGVVNAGTNTISNTSCAAAANAQSWAMGVILKTSTSNAWCVDSTGVSKLEPAGAIFGYNALSQMVCN